VDPIVVGLISIPVWGALLSWLYIQYVLKSRKKPVVWLGGPKSLQNYRNFLAVIAEESDSRQKATLRAVYIFHWICVVMMFGVFIALIL
jgi:hypothetical protein